MFAEEKLNINEEKLLSVGTLSRATHFCFIAAHYFTILI